MPHRYTFIAEFRGGTYCIQVEAMHVQDAVLAWVKQLPTSKNEIRHLGNKTIAAIESQACNQDVQPVPLNGLSNVWYLHCGTRQGAWHINIVRTFV
jgi:hypothetical protein